MDDQPEADKRILVRLPRELADQIAELAADEDRSINSQIVHLLKRALAQKDGKKGQEIRMPDLAVA